MAGSESGIVYTLKRASDLSDVSSAFGTGGSLTFDTGELTGPTDFVVSAESDKQSIYLDGQQSGMYFPENDVLDMTDNFTIEGWIKPNGTLGWSRVFNKDNSYALGLSSSQSRLTFSVHSTADYWVEYAFVTGEWYHIACTYSAGVVEFYVNGQSAGSQSNVATPTLRDYGARLDKYLAGGPNTPGLAASWWLIEGDGTAFDYSVNELHGVEQDVLWEENVPHEVCSFDLSTMLTVETINIIDQDVVAYETIVCSGGETIIELYETQPEITYILKNESTGQLIDGPYVGDGGTITFITGPIAGPNFFNVHAMAIQGTTVMCEQIMSVVPFINGIDDLEAPIVIGLESIESPCALEEINQLPHH